MSDFKPYPFSPLEDLVEVLDHLRAPVNSEERSLRPGTVPYYGATGLQGWIDKALTNEPLILLAEDGGNFDAFADRPIAYRIDGPAWVNNHAHIIRAKPGVSQSFVFWSIAHKDIRRFIAGGTRTKLTQSEMRRIEVPSPDPTDQVQIAAVLDTLDTTIRQTEAIIEKLKQVKQGLLHDLLTRGIDANGELRPPQSEAPHLYKASPLGWIPTDWTDCALGSLLAGIDGGWSPDCQEVPPPEGCWGVLKLSAITSGKYLASESKTLPDTLLPDPSIEVHAGDVLLARANGVAELVATTVFVDSTPSRLMLSDKTLRLRPVARLLSPRFLALLMSFDSTRRQIRGMLNGSSGQQNISQRQITNLVVALPSFSEQQAIEARLEAADLRISRETQTEEKLRRTKSGLMDDLLTGRVRVTPLLARQAA